MTNYTFIAIDGNDLLSKDKISEPETVVSKAMLYYTEANLANSSLIVSVELSIS